MVIRSKKQQLAALVREMLAYAKRNPLTPEDMMPDGFSEPYLRVFGTTRILCTVEQLESGTLRHVAFSGLDGGPAEYDDVFGWLGHFFAEGPAVWVRDDRERYPRNTIFVQRSAAWIHFRQLEGI